MTQDAALTILKTGANVFLTGEPGSGKTHTINQYVAWLRSHGIEPAITASTGIAATHIGGMTVHSWSGIGIKSRLDKYDLDRIASNERVAKRIRNSKILIIDEVSMLPAETVSMVDAVCCEVMQKTDPFGGLQVIFVGDFFQLPPVVRMDPGQQALALSFVEWPPSRFAYLSPAWTRANPIACYLTEQYRQDDKDFLNMLSAIRHNEFAAGHLHHIAKRKIDRNAVPQNVPKLFSHNADVDRINTETLGRISSVAKTFDMSSYGPPALVETLIKNCLSPSTLSLKVSAAVMFTKNNPKEGFVNGTLGIVQGFVENVGYPIVKIHSGREIEVEPMEWTVEENGSVCASVTQVPLRLAWAITVHKSQGMSLDEAVMDLTDVFEFGQGYVALSRVRRLSGLHLLGWNERTFQVHPEVLIKDVDFRGQSEQVEIIFSKMTTKEINLMHEQFVKACTGTSIRLSVNAQKKSKANSTPLAKIREKYPNAYQPWTQEHDARLQEFFADKVSVASIAKTFGRQSSAIRSRLVKLGLLDNYFKGKKSS
ncbi:MAG: AAA family ATPase [Candidatus Spechtbacteria bacterium]|nr:AAA family ATPase [Candidatus Spechtbacteria bacterium]